ncbi:MAG: hypothetical protein E7460_07150 [Ruminococcaceae bacterium]|nr:hypothetical protein [Oscillospiraceae bacterium]
MKVKLTAVIITLVLLLSSCAVDPSAKDAHLFATRHYVSTEVTYSEPTAQFAFKLNMESTETELAKYYFEPTVGNKERKACIKATEKVLATQEPISPLPEIYIFSRDRYDYKLVRDHKLYSSLREWKSVEYTTDVLLALYGEAAHYGTVFGYAEYLSGSCEGRFTLPSVDDVMDLSYLCFDEAFVSPADVAVAKEIACDFVNTGISQQGEAAFRQLLTSPTQATAALCAYYSEKGLSYTPSAVQYGYGGRSYDYTVHTEYATFYIANDWADMCAELNPLITDGFLHADYPSTKAFFETNLEQMKQYQDLFNTTARGIKINERRVRRTSGVSRLGK